MCISMNNVRFQENIGHDVDTTSENLYKTSTGS